MARRMDFNLKKLFSSIAKPTNSIPKRIVGIDVGASSIKVVELEQTTKALMLRTYGELQLGPYAEKDLGEAVTLEEEKLTEALVDVIREASVNAKDGVLSIPLSLSFVTIVPVSLKEGETLESKVRVEARKYIPVPLTDIMLDWTQLHEYGDRHARVHEVLLAAIQNDAFSRYQSLMNSVQMVSQPSEIEVFSTIRSIFGTQDTTLAVIDLGAETSKLFIVREGSLERIHRVYDGGATCTKRIAHLLSVTFEEAENLKRSYTPDSEHAHDIQKAFRSSVERSAQEFKQVISQYEARIGEPLGRIAVTGGVASFPGTEKYLSDIFARDVVRAKPFAKIAYPAFMEDTLDEIGVSFSTALGAALRPYES